MLLNKISKTLEDENKRMELRIKQLEQMQRGQEDLANFLDSLVDHEPIKRINIDSWAEHSLAKYQEHVLMTTSRNHIVVVTRPLIELGIRKATCDLVNELTLPERVSCYINENILLEGKRFMPDVQMNMRELEHCADESAVLEELRNMHKTLFELPPDVIIAQNSGLDHANENTRLVCIHDSAPFRTACALILAELQKQGEVPQTVLFMEPQFKLFCWVMDGGLSVQNPEETDDEWS